MILPAREPDKEPSGDPDLPDFDAPYSHTDPDTDCFKPPAEPTEIGCLHCQQIFMSNQMRYVIETDKDGNKSGHWCCPDPKCDGRGFLFDLLPTDPDWRDEDGNRVWFETDEDDEDWDDDLDDDGHSLGFDPPQDWTPESDEEDDIPF